MQDATFTTTEVFNALGELGHLARPVFAAMLKARGEAHTRDALEAMLGVRPRTLVPVFTVEVDQDDPHYIVVTRNHAGLLAANRFTLAGVTLGLVELAQSRASGSLPYREEYPPGHPCYTPNEGAR